MLSKIQRFDLKYPNENCWNCTSQLNIVWSDAILVELQEKFYDKYSYKNCNKWLSYYLVCVTFWSSVRKQMEKVIYIYAW